MNIWRAILGAFVLVAAWGCGADGPSEYDADQGSDLGGLGGDHYDPLPLKSCSSRVTGFETCCSYVEDQGTWEFTNAPCPGAEDCDPATDCPPGYAERALPRDVCTCLDDEGGTGTCRVDGTCPLGELMVHSALFDCGCDPLGVGTCVSAMEPMFDNGQGTGICASAGYDSACAQYLGKDPLRGVSFCSDCPCATVDFRIPIKTSARLLLDTYMQVWNQGDPDTCCTFDAESEAFSCEGSRCPGFSDCSLQDECPPGYTESGDAESCLCRPNSGGSCGEEGVLSEVAPGDSCPAPAPGTVVFRCQAKVPDDGTAFCASCPCPMVDRNLFTTK